jgi:hypothetical protein
MLLLLLLLLLLLGPGWVNVPCKQCFKGEELQESLLIKHA